MPMKCGVPGCRGNYKFGPKVHVFRFPQDEELRKTWLRAMGREESHPVNVKNSRVCDLHFTENDILRETSYTDVATGRVLTARLAYPRLRPEAVPSKFPDSGQCRVREQRLSSKTSRDHPNAAAKEGRIAETIEAVVEMFRSEEETDRRRLRPRQNLNADGKRKATAGSVETALETSSSWEDTDREGGTKDPDTGRTHSRRRRPRRKRPRQVSSDSDYVQMAIAESIDAFSSEEEADKVHSVKGSGRRRKRPRRSPCSDDIQRVIAESIETVYSEDEADEILNLKDLADYARNQQYSTFWHAVEGSKRLILVHIVEDEAPWIKYSVVLKADLTLTCYVAKTPVTKLGSSLCIPTAVKSKRALKELLESIENWDSSLSSTSESLDEDISETVCLLPGKSTATPTEDKAAAIQFLREQFNLLSMKKDQRRYSADLMVFSCILFTISPHAYKYICNSGNVSLPHPMIIRSVCLSFGMNSQPLQQNATFLRYVANRISDLDYRQRLVTIMVDEIHIGPFFDYKGGSTTDVAPNSTEVAGSVLVFTVQSLTCQFKEVAHVVPMQRADAQFLHKLLSDVICGLEKIGYRVACVVSDGSSVNKEAMSHFTSPPTEGIVYPHPSDPARPLFFVIDPVNILKCIRNSWLDQSNDLLCFYFPEFHAEPTRARRMLSGSFATIRDAYNLERHQLVRYGYSLSREALCPMNAERENVKLALQIFNDSLPQVLRTLGAKHNLRFFEETARFIEIIVKWWKIVNVKAPYKEKTSGDQFQEPLFPSVDDPKVDFLYRLLDWLDEWKGKDLDSGTLTSETHAALQHTTHALVEVARYCFTELKLSRILLGKIQTDNLEERFGNSKHLAGPQYHNSIRQLHEGEGELQPQDSLPTVAAACETENDEDEQWEDLHKREHTFRPGYAVGVTGEALLKLEDTLPALVYVAGYAVHATLERLNCVKCRPVLSVNKAINISVAQRHFKLVKELEGRGLLFPTMFAINAVAYSYVVAQQLSKQAESSKVPNPRQLVADLTVELLTNEGSSEFDVCEDGHTSELVLRHVLWCSTNVLLKNFFCRMNNETVANAKSC
ncbi:uncharacterized protein LOC115329104 [Ixodes scapularis]|uniref:uncharacterized protein LOC115329104 n=1 Tax=Ixodes scapularis TaxID=6945 RepID=UPI001C38CFC4|nr:uncharacterized protein LOC115329104 [Ixodes scapularis]